MNLLHILRIFFGSVYILFFPGFILTFVFFKNKPQAIDWLERIILSIALSIAVVPLMVFIFNLCGIAITATNVFIEILCLILLSLGIVYFNGKKKKL